MPQNPHERDIELASFLVRAKPRIIMITITVTLIIELVLVALFVVFWGRFAVSRGEITSRLSLFSASVRSVTEVQRLDHAQALRVLGSNVFSASEGKQDAVAIVENPNTQWIARVAISVPTENGPVRAEQPIVIMPLEKRVLGVYGVAHSVSGTSVSIDSITWTRVDPHEVSNISAFLKEHAQFDIVEPRYVNASGAVTTDRILYSITNQSPYNYFEVEMDVVMYLDTTVIGVEQTTITGLHSGETKTVELHAVPRGVSPTTIEILPHVDYFDAKSYMKIEA